MATIMHQVGIRASAAEVYAALTTLDGLAAWWTRDTLGCPQVGSQLDFHFGDQHMELVVVNQQPETLVHWRCVAGDPQWEGTEILFRLHEDPPQVIVDFTHGYWRDTTDQFMQCSTKWAVYLLSLKDYLETGAGQPYPVDVPIIDPGRQARAG